MDATVIKGQRQDGSHMVYSFCGHTKVYVKISDDLSASPIQHKPLLRTWLIKNDDITLKLS